MRISTLTASISAAMLCASAATARADSLRCGGRLVSEGDSALELKVRCGPPDHREIRPVLEATGVESARVGRVRGAKGSETVVLQPPALRRVVTTRERIETWLYAGDDGALPRLVTVRRGKVHRIRTLSGFDVRPDAGCARAIHRRSLPIGAVHLACGAPDDVAEWEELDEVESNGLIRKRLRVRQRWTYHPGPGRLLRVLEFENGRLLRVETGARAPD